jgi:transketolase
MKFKLKNKFVNEAAMMRDTYCNTLLEMAKNNKDIVVLDADLMSSMGMKPFLAEYPDRTFNCGVQEANMIGVAAGLSATGKIPYAHTFGPFATRRVMDQVFISAAYARLNIRIVGSDPGITAAYNGGTHMPFEDMAVMRTIPTVTALEPTDGVMLADLIKQTEKLYGVFYIRLQRKFPVGIYEEGSTFDIGKGVTLMDGNDVTIIASGIMVMEALDAACQLNREGISVRVVNLFTWKPIDGKLIEACAKETGAIVTAENHNVISGLASAVASELCFSYPVPMEAVGVFDEFGEVGNQDYLRKRFKLSSDEIVFKAKKAISRKK